MVVKGQNCHTELVKCRQHDKVCWQSIPVNYRHVICMGVGMPCLSRKLLSVNWKWNDYNERRVFFLHAGEHSLRRQLMPGKETQHLYM